MAQSSTAIRAIKRDVPFIWEGKDKRGKVVKGKREHAPELEPCDGLLGSIEVTRDIAEQLLVVFRPCEREELRVIGQCAVE